MKETAEILKDVVINIGPILKQIEDAAASKKPMPNKWSAKEIMGHLIDSANNNQMRIVNSTSTAKIDVVAYQQEEWVENQKYNDADWHGLIDFWSQFNLHIAHIMENTPTNALKNEIKVNGEGPFTLAFMMKDYVIHLKHHLTQILPERVLDTAFKPTPKEWMLSSEK